MGRKRPAKQVDRTRDACLPEQIRNDRSDCGQPSSSIFFVAGIAGLLLGAGAFAWWTGGIDGWINRPDKVAKNNALLSAQQLDELFWQIDKRLTTNTSEIGSFYEMLQIYYLYDNRFVEQNKANIKTQAETAYATQRLAQCAAIFGEVDSSKAYFKQSQRQFATLLNKNPKLISHLSGLIDAHVNVARIDLATGDIESSKAEFVAAVRAVDQTLIPKSHEYHHGLGPHFHTLTGLALDLGLEVEALSLARRFVESTKALVQSNPEDQEWQRRALEAQSILNSLNEKRQLIEN